MMQRIFCILILIICLTGELFAQELLAPNLKGVSIDPATGNVIVKWTNPNDASVSHVEISRRPYAGLLYSFDSIGAIYIPDSVFIDNGVSDINNNRQTYRIRSANATKYSAITSMHLTSTANATYNACLNAIEVRWTPYKQLFVDANGKVIEPHEPEDTFNNAIKYEVWGYNGTAPFSTANAVKLGSTTGNTIDTLRNVTVNGNYYLFIKTFLSNNDTVTSYRVQLPTSARKEPTYMNIDSVISTNGNIELYFGIDNSTQLDTFALYRTDIKNKPIYWYHGSVPSKYVDRDIQLGLSYSYYLGVFRCGKLAMISDTVNNILLFANTAGLSSIIRWSEFTDKLAAYELTRLEPEPQSIIYTTNSNYAYTDDIKLLLEDGFFKYCYSITASNGKSFARSETQCITVEPSITMPDAIDPLSDIVNPNTGNRRNQFGPTLSFKDDKYRFTLEIFNKAGVRIFKSSKEFNDNLSRSLHYWDGKYNNSYVKEDVYIYSLKFEFRERKPFVQNGTVTVVYRQ